MICFLCGSPCRYNLNNCDKQKIVARYVPVDCCAPGSPSSFRVYNQQQNLDELLQINITKRCSNRYEYIYIKQTKFPNINASRFDSVITKLATSCKLVCIS
jgi:hypothetical protein